MKEMEKQDTTESSLQRELRCAVCCTTYTPDDVIPINGTEVETERLRSRMLTSTKSTKVQLIACGRLAIAKQRTEEERQTEEDRGRI